MPRAGDPPDTTKVMTAQQRNVSYMYDATRALLRAWEQYGESSGGDVEALKSTTARQHKLIGRTLTSLVSSPLAAELRQPKSQYDTFCRYWTSSSTAADVPKAWPYLKEYGTMLNNTWPALQLLLYGPPTPPPAPPSQPARGKATAADVTLFTELSQKATKLAEALGHATDPASDVGVKDVIRQIGELMLSEPSAAAQRDYLNLAKTWKGIIEFTKTSRWIPAKEEAGVFRTQANNALVHVKELAQ